MTVSREPAHRIMARSALDGLRAYPGTAASIAVALGVTLAVVVPATLFAALGDSGLQSRLGITPILGGDLGLAWREMVRSPAATQQQAASTLVLLMICLTVAMVAIAVVTIFVLAGLRESARMPEIAVRRAVGASRRTLFGGLAIEAALVILAAMATGGIAAWILMRLALARWPGVLQPGAPTLSLLAVAGLAAVVAFGIMLPILWPRRQLADGDTPAPTPLAPTAFQLGVSLVALTAGSLLLRHAAVLTHANAAPANDGVVIPLTLDSAAPHVRAARYEALLLTLAANDSVEAASLTSPGALVGLGPVSWATTDCGICYVRNALSIWHTREVTYHLVSSDSFRVLDLSLLGGRALTAADTWDAPRVAVVSRSLAQKEFQDGEAIGRHIRVIDQGFSGWSTVVGVVDDVASTGFGGVLQPQYAVYLSVLQHPPTAVELVVRGSSSSPDVPRVVHTALQTASLGVASSDAWRRESAVAAAETRPAAWFGWWFSVQGWAMLGLAVLGTFVVMQLWVRSLANEIGVRRAMGARRLQVLRLVLARAAGVGIAGGLVGLWLGPGIWTIAPSVLPGLPVWDSGLVLRFAALLMGVALAGALLPAWRAARTAPVALISAR